MTNEQIRTWMNKYRRELGRAIDGVEEKLPKEQLVVGKNMFGGKFNYSEVTRPFRDILSDLTDDMENLRSK